MCFEKILEIFANALGILALCLIGSTVVFSLIGVGVGVLAGIIALVPLFLVNPILWVFILALMVLGLLLLNK